MTHEFLWLLPARCILLQGEAGTLAYQRLALQPLRLQQGSLETHFPSFPAHPRAQQRILELLRQAPGLYCAQLIYLGQRVPLLLRITRTSVWQLELFQLDLSSVRRVGYVLAVRRSAPPYAGPQGAASLFILDLRVDFFGGKKLGTYLLTLLQRLACQVEHVTSITGELSPQDDVAQLQRFYHRLGFELQSRGEQLQAIKQLSPVHCSAST